jgi:hypothetical protein
MAELSGTTYEGRVICSRNTKETAEWMTPGPRTSASVGRRRRCFYSRVPIHDGSGTDNPPANQDLGSFRTDSVDRHMDRMLKVGA